MPSVKVCLWNIQNYGWGDPWKKHGVNSSMRNAFIARFADVHAIDVLLVQEVAASAGASLVNLARTLNGGNTPTQTKDWVYSLCGSAMKDTSPSPPASADDLTFKTDARFEGYAVLWKQNQQRFRLVPALNDVAAETWPANGQYAATSPLNLSTTGRPTRDADRLPQFAVTGGYTSPDQFPRRNNAPVNPWPELVMPVTSSGSATGLSVADARRPASVTLRLSDGSLVPVSVYHAPSNPAAARWGARLSALSRELYVANDYDANTGRPVAGQYVYAAKAVMGGDYNYGVDGDKWPAWYANYTGAFSAAADGGASCTEAPPHAAGRPARRSTVKLLTGRAGSPNIDGTAAGDYLSLMIDLAFFRTGSGITAKRVDVLQELIDNDPSYRVVLRQYMVHLNWVVTWYRTHQADDFVMDPDTGPALRDWKKVNGKWVEQPKALFSGNWGGTFVDWDAFKEMMTRGHLDVARQSAEFYQIFISDHLPLVVTIPVP